MADLRQQSVGIGHRELEVLGRDAIDDRARLGEIARAHQRHRGDRARLAMMSARGISARSRRALSSTRSISAASGVTRIACAISSCSACAEEVERDPVGIRRAVGDDDDLGDAGDHVDADRAEHATLGRGDVGVARTADLVDGGHGRGAVGQRGDRLRAADGEYAGDAGKVRGGEDQGIAHAIGRRHRHHDLGHARHARGQRVHQHRRRVRGLAAGHVDADAVERRHALAELAAVGLRDLPAACLLALVIAAHARRRPA